MRVPKFLDSPYLIREKNNWHLKDGAPEEVKREFDGFMKALYPLKIDAAKKSLRGSKLKLVIDLNRGIFREEEHPRDQRGRFTTKEAAKHTDIKWKDEKGNYKPERLKLHNAIVDQINTEAGESHKKPLAVLMGGGSATGKSTLRNVTVMAALKGEGQSAGIVDSDDIKNSIPEYKTLGRDIAARTVHDESSDIANYALDTLIKNKKNLIFDGTMKNYKKYSAMIERLKKEGYEVQILIADCPLEVAIERATKRAKETGRKVPTEIIEESHRSVPEAFVKLKSLVDRYDVFDTSGNVPERIHSNEEVVLEKYNKFLTKGGASDPETEKGGKK